MNNKMTAVAINWTDDYMGKPWTKQENCFFHVSKIIKDFKDHVLPVVDDLSFYARTRVLLKEEKRHWHTVAQPAEHFDLVLMRHIGSNQNAHHIGVWTKANGGAVFHAVEEDYTDLDSLFELSLRGFEVKRVMRLKESFK